MYIHIYIYIYTSEDLSLYSDRVKWSSRLVFGPKVDGQHALSMYFFFYIFDRWSIVMLKGSMFFL